jgi:membrane-associated phospholipid phosphatase
LGEQLGRWWWLKATGTSAFMVGFFLIYFQLLNHPIRPPFEMPLTVVDRWMPFWSWAVFPYVSLWVYVSLAPAMLGTFSELWRYLVGALALSGVGFLIFYFFPTAVPTSDLDWSAYPMVAFLKSADAGGNAFPSLHVAFAVFSAFVIAREGDRLGAPHWFRSGNCMWAALIAVSTLLTRQHVFYDLVAGAMLGVIFGVALVRWLDDAPRSRE